MSKRVAFIVNPVSGVGKQRRIETLLKRHIDHDMFQYDVWYTEYAHHGKLLARKAADQRYDSVVAVGGDGSVNDVVCGIYGSESALGIIPTGSGNGLARCMKIPTNPSLAIRYFNLYNENIIDTIILNDRHIITSIAGIGFDSHIAHLMQHVKTRGLPAYINLIIKEYKSYPNHDYRLCINGQDVTKNAWFITFANSNQFGFNFAIAPQARLNDGLIDISIVDKIPLEHIPITSPLVYMNHFELSQHVEMFKTNEVIVYNNENRWVNIDGEGEQIGEELRFVNHKKSLKVIAAPTFKESIKQIVFK